MHKKRKTIAFYSLFYLIIILLAILGLSINIKTNNIHEATRPLEKKLNNIKNKNNLLRQKVLEKDTLSYLASKAKDLQLAPIRKKEYVSLQNQP
ncbi:MAG: hypothetical protein VW378_04700 [bacterium]